MADTTAVAARRRIDPDEKYCFECGEVIRARAEICPHCGVRQPDVALSANRQDEGRNKVVAALLGVFLGGLGIHKFYLGRPWWGVLYLLLCWTGIPVVVGFIEGVIYLAMSKRSFDRKYNAPGR